MLTLVLLGGCTAAARAVHPAAFDPIPSDAFPEFVTEWKQDT